MSEGHALGHALVDDGVGDLGEAVNVGFASAEVTTLDGVVEQTTHGVAIVLVVLGSVDATLSGDGVSTTRAVIARNLKSTLISWTIPEVLESSLVDHPSDNLLALGICPASSPAF